MDWSVTCLGEAELACDLVRVGARQDAHFDSSMKREYATRQGLSLSALNAKGHTEKWLSARVLVLPQSVLLQS